MIIPAMPEASLMPLPKRPAKAVTTLKPINSGRPLGPCITGIFIQCPNCNVLNETTYRGFTVGAQHKCGRCEYAWEVGGSDSHGAD